MQTNLRSELDYWLAFYFMKGIGFQTVNSLISLCEPAEFFSATPDKLRLLGIDEKVITALNEVDWHAIDTLKQQCSLAEIQIIYFTHPEYPLLLKEISSPPLILFCLGDLTLLQSPKLAVVGSRSATSAGRQMSFEIASSLAHQDFCVVSGMARGVDGAAHQGALDVAGQTIAVLGTGVDICYPARAKELYQNIKQTGLLISEYLPGTKAKAVNFPRRNRIISGLSVGTIVVEAEIKSGSLITARYALEQNREVFAVPGSVFNEMARGCHMLIKQGAKLIENCEDIFSELSVLPKSCLYIKEGNVKGVSEDCIVEFLSDEVTSVDKLQDLTNIAMDELLSRLLDLELEGTVTRVLDGYTLNRRK